jgi:CMP-N-acetylneuraminic acid synthetase
VSTDSTEIAEEASTAGAQVHWRSSESATDFAPSIVGVQDFCSFHPGLILQVASVDKTTLLLNNLCGCCAQIRKMEICLLFFVNID